MCSFRFIGASPWLMKTFPSNGWVLLSLSFLLCQLRFARSWLMHQCTSLVSQLLDASGGYRSRKVVQKSFTWLICWEEVTCLYLWHVFWGEAAFGSFRRKKLEKTTSKKPLGSNLLRVFCDVSHLSIELFWRGTGHPWAPSHPSSLNTLPSSQLELSAAYRSAQGPSISTAAKKRKDSSNCAHLVLMTWWWNTMRVMGRNGWLNSSLPKMYGQL